MNIFLTGATGYIGFNVAKTMRRAGHVVWGLTQSKEKASMLAKEEIHAVIGDMSNPESYQSVAENCSVLIHAAVDYEHDTAELDKKTVQTLIKIGGSGAKPKTIIYTSGCWVHGNTGHAVVEETSPLDPIEAVHWRPEVEQSVLNADGVKGIVVRPGCVYGKQGGLTGIWFNQAYNEQELQPVGDGTNFWSIVHVDDLADAYRRMAESNFSGKIFNVSDRSRWTVGDMTRAVAKAADYTGDINFIPAEEAAEEMGPMAEALAVNQHVSSRKAANLLGWQPRHGGFVDEVETFFEAWKAHNL